MKESLKTGISFGLTSGIITTLGLMVGLQAGTNSKMIVIGGILTIAIADAFSDALGIHISEESSTNFSVKGVWESTLATFLTKFVTAMIFLIPVLLFKLSTAVGVCIGMGLVLLGIFSYMIAKMQKTKPLEVVGEHIFIAVLVIIITHIVGDWIAKVFV